VQRGSRGQRLQTALLLLPSNILVLAEESRVRTAGPHRIELRQKSGAGQGKGVIALPRAEFVQQPDAVALTARKWLLSACVQAIPADHSSEQLP
jgi:hypothetical protein